MKLWGLFRFGMNAHKPFPICGYSFQSGLRFQRDGNSFCSGLPGIAAEHKESTDQISLTDANKLLFY